MEAYREARRREMTETTTAQRLLELVAQWQCRGNLGRQAENLLFSVRNGLLRDEEFLVSLAIAARDNAALVEALKQIAGAQVVSISQAVLISINPERLAHASQTVDVALEAITKYKSN